jgi:hypothetical protein
MKNPISLIVSLLLTIQVLLLTTPVAGQTRTSLASLEPVIIRLPHPVDSGKPAPEECFSHFEVLDERPDTGRIGVHTCIPDFGSKHDRQLIFTRSAALEISSYLNRHFARRGAPYTALIVLRTLWLSDASYIREDMVRDPDKRFDRTHIRLKAEIYALRDGHYLPILRFDSFLVALKKPLYQERSPYYEWGQNLGDLFDDLADSVARLTALKQDKGRWVGWEDIRQFNTARFDAAIDDNTPRARGVYANFKEFRNNTPSITDFEIRLEDNQRLLYIRESGVAYYSHDAWGYCDGKDIYIMRDGALCPAWKEEKAFYFYTLPRRSHPHYNDYIQTVMASRTQSSRKIDFRTRNIYSVDMDTGDIY